MSRALADQSTGGALCRQQNAQMTLTAFVHFLFVFLLSSNLMDTGTVRREDFFLYKYILHS